MNEKILREDGSIDMIYLSKAIYADGYTATLNKLENEIINLMRDACKPIELDAETIIKEYYALSEKIPSSSNEKRIDIRKYEQNVQAQ